MSLQELRDTLFNYVGPLVYEQLLGPEHKLNAANHSQVMILPGIGLVVEGSPITLE